MNNQKPINSFASFESEKLDQIKKVLTVTSGWLAVPLYFLFWVADLIYAPQLAVEFLLLRLTIIPLLLIIRYRLPKIDKLNSIQLLALAATFWYAQIICVMIFLSGSADSIYYAGLNLVCIGMLSFIPWQSKFLPLVIFAVYGPYISISVYLCSTTSNWSHFILNFFFIAATSAISIVIRLYQAELQQRDYLSRKNLHDELQDRENIIVEKSAENVKLNILSRNFSPQVVDSVMSGKLNISSDIQKVEICSFFIDIADSTKKLMTLSENKFAASIARFLDDVMRIASNFDATIDKFNGDQIVVFSNAPVMHRDYIERIVTMACLIRKQIKNSSSFYESNWDGPLEVYIGIAAGEANVGFYGHNKIMQSYSALGLPVNLAARLCAKAKANEILISQGVMDVVSKNSNFNFGEMGETSLKGFTDLVPYYSLLDDSIVIENVQEFVDGVHCPKCQGRTTLYERNSIWFFRCIVCGTQLQ